MNKTTGIQKKWIVYLLLPLLLGCSEIRLIGAYNQHVDQSIQAISKDISTLFVQIENNIDDGKDYSYNSLRDSYIKIESEIQSCITVAGGIPKYNIIINQLNTLYAVMKQFQAQHKTGFVAPSVTDPQKIKDSFKPDKAAITAALSAMFQLQEGLKREKSDRKK